MRLRLTIAMAIQLIAVLFSFMGWVDPLEGGAAVVIVGFLTIVTRFVGAVRVPKLTWMSIAGALILAVSTVAVLLAEAPTEPDGVHVAADLPPTVIILLWLYRAAAVAVIAGTVFYAIRIWDERRKSAIS